MQQTSRAVADTCAKCFGDSLQQPSTIYEQIESVPNKKLADITSVACATPQKQSSRSVMSFAVRDSVSVVRNCCCNAIDIKRELSGFKICKHTKFKVLLNSICSPNRTSFVDVLCYRWQRQYARVFASTACAWPATVQECSSTKMKIFKIYKHDLQQI